LIAKHTVIPHTNIKSSAQAALLRTSADGYPCPAAAGKINLELANGLCAAQLPGSAIEAG
jgi:hypothetical protein